jgi:hypothetical protein
MWLGRQTSSPPSNLALPSFTIVLCLNIVSRIASLRLIFLEPISLACAFSHTRTTFSQIPLRPCFVQPLPLTLKQGCEIQQQHRTSTVIFIDRFSLSKTLPVFKIVSNRIISQHGVNTAAPITELTSGPSSTPFWT